MQARQLGHMPSNIGSALKPLPVTAKLLEKSHWDADKMFGFESPAQDNASYDLDGDGKLDVFEAVSPTKHVRVVIDRVNRTREEFVATNLSQFGNGATDPVKYYSKESFAGGFSEFVEGRGEDGQVRSATITIRGDMLHHEYSTGETWDQRIGGDGKSYEKILEDVELSENTGFRIG